MARTCALIPQVTNNKGQKVDSKLFKGLLGYTGNNREEAVRLYLITKNADFIRHWNPKFTLDDNNEPKIQDLLRELPKYGEKISEAKIIKMLNKEVGYYKRGSDRPALWINNDENYRRLLQKAISFNQNSDFRDDYVARIIKIQDNESYREFIGVEVRKRNRMLSLEADKMEYNTNLNNRLRDILESHGVKVGVLTNLEERLGINGVADFDTAKVSADGMIELIRLANGDRGERALPEEFAHFALEALGDHPLVNRLINNLHSNDLVEDILGDEYETYNTLYNGDTVKLAKEAAGKLLAKHLLNTEPIEQKPYKNLLERVIAAIKSLFKTIGATQVQRAIYQADTHFKELARDILSGRLDEDISIDNIASGDKLYQISERVQRDKKLLTNIIGVESKRLKIYEKRNPKSQFDVKQREFIDKLQLMLDENNEIEGVYSFLTSALEEMGKLSNRLSSIRDNSSGNIAKEASVLRDIRNYIYSYGDIIEEIRDVLLDEERYKDNRYGQKVRGILNDTAALIADLRAEYNKVAMPLFLDFLKPFIGNQVEISFGKYKGKTMAIEDLMTAVDKDISIFDRWLDSMADSSDIILRVVDQAVKRSKENARTETLNIMKQLQAATIKLERAGIKDTDWMFERDNNGDMTGYYISEINWPLFKEKRDEFIKSLDEKYGKVPIGEDAIRYNREQWDWIKNNMERVDGKMVPKLSLYTNSKFNQLSNAQKEYYNIVMDVKAKLDSYLPEKSTNLLNAVKIRKDLLERVKSSDSIKSGTKQIWESLKDTVIRRSDDTDFGEKNIMMDFEGREVQTLPIYYTRLKKGENPNDISTDIVSTLTAYAAMANDYKEMNRIIDVLEVGRSLIRDREVTQTNGERPLVEKFKIFGRTIENKLTKSGDATNISSRLEDFFDMQVYNRYMKDEGTFGKTKIDKGKAANLLNTITSIGNMALNTLLAVSNVATGKVMMRIEAFSKEFFTEKDVLKADKTYMRDIRAFLGEIGNRIKISKLALWNEKFNIMQDYEQNIRDLNFDRKTWFSRMFSMNALFFLTNAGEHWMQTRTSLALANAYKMRAPDGRIVSLYDAMEVVPVDKNNRKAGARLQLKEGYTKEDGTPFTKEDEYKFSRRSAALNERMHGIYNKADRNALQKLALGRLGMMYRKWMRSAYNRRFKPASYNYDLDAWTEGYYRTSGRFLLQLARDLREAQFNIAARWNELTTTEKANLARAMTEVGHFAVVATILGIIDWDDDKDRPWAMKMAEYQARRLYTEIGVMIPGKSMVTEGLRILQSPAAGINTIQNILNLTKLLNPMNYMDELEYGRYKGHSTAYKAFFDSPVIPFNKTIYRGLHPEEAISFFKQQ